MDYETLRRRMIDEQLVPRGISDPAVLDAFWQVQRHRFVPQDLRSSAYADSPLPIGNGQTISQPYIVALMTELLELKKTDRVLEVGTGSGYQTAILARLAGKIYSVERDPVLAMKARSLLQEMGYADIKILIADGTLGWQEEAPFNKIIVTAASPQVPLPMTEQLLESGKLIIPLEGALGQTLTLVEKKNATLTTRPVCGCVFVPLIGAYGFKEKGDAN